MDITLQVIFNPKTHDLSYDTQKQARRYRRGDIVGVMLTGNTGLPSFNRPFAFIHITGVPNRPIAQIRARLTTPAFDPLVLVNDNPAQLRRRRWRIPRSILPQGIIDQLIANRQVTVTWAQVKPFVRKKLISNKLK